VLDFQKSMPVSLQAWSVSLLVDWRFTTTDARIKLKHLYPKLQV
jgi:hypothetical protein